MKRKICYTLSDNYVFKVFFSLSLSVWVFFFTSLSISIAVSLPLSISAFISLPSLSLSLSFVHENAILTSHMPRQKLSCYRQDQLTICIIHTHTHARAYARTHTHTQIFTTFTIKGSCLLFFLQFDLQRYLLSL